MALGVIIGYIIPKKKLAKIITITKEDIKPKMATIVDTVNPLDNVKI
jgi:hypothetical protein